MRVIVASHRPRPEESAGTTMNWFVWAASLLAILAGPIVTVLLLRAGVSAVRGRLRPARGRWRGALDLLVAALFAWGVVVAAIHFPWLWPFLR